jgi:hypothetical protein
MLQPQRNLGHFLGRQSRRGLIARVRRKHYSRQYRHFSFIRTRPQIMTYVADSHRGYDGESLCCPLRGHSSSAPF